MTPLQHPNSPVSPLTPTTRVSSIVPAQRGAALEEGAELARLASDELEKGKIESAVLEAKAALAAFDETDGDVRTAVALRVLGEVAAWEGDRVAARGYFERAVAMSEGSQPEARLLVELALLELTAHELDAAPARL